MKRFFVFLLAFVFCLSVLVVPALAAETDEYVFEVLPHVSLYTDYEFSFFGELQAVYEGRLPEGFYDVYFIIDGESILLYSSFFVDYSLFTERDGFCFYCSLSPVIDGPLTCQFVVSDLYDLLGGTLFEVHVDGDYSALDLSAVKFVPSKVRINSPLDLFSYLMQRLYLMIIDNPLLSALFAGSLILVCIPIYSRAKKSMR